MENLTANDIKPTPDFGTVSYMDYTLGVATVKSVMKSLLDIDQVFSDSHSAELEFARISNQTIYIR